MRGKSLYNERPAKPLFDEEGERLPPVPALDKYGRELVYARYPLVHPNDVHEWVERKNGTIPNRAERRKHGIRRPLALLEQHRDLMESLVEVADEGVEEIGAEPGVEDAR